MARLGERESGTARLEEAVAAYRAALEEWTRERVPLDWADDPEQSRLCAWTLGERESGTARLEEAVAAYREALEEWTRETRCLSKGGAKKPPLTLRGFAGPEATQWGGVGGFAFSGAVGEGARTPTPPRCPKESHHPHF